MPTASVKCQLGRSVSFGSISWCFFLDISFSTAQQIAFIAHINHQILHCSPFGAFSVSLSTVSIISEMSAKKIHKSMPFWNVVCLEFVCVCFRVLSVLSFSAGENGMQCFYFEMLSHIIRWVNVCILREVTVFFFLSLSSFLTHSW